MDEFEEVAKPILRKKRPQNRKTKTVLIFDEAARKEYLTGFQKRKNERRKRAKAENEKKLKEERQALKQQVRDMIRKSDSHRIPELEHLVDSTVYDLPEHTVTITDVSEVDLSRGLGKTATDDSEKQDSSQKRAEGEDAAALKKKQKKLIHKLAQVGNPASKTKKVKRLGKGKFKGGGGGGGSRGKGKFGGGGSKGGKGKFNSKGKDRSHHGGNRNHKSNKKHRH